MNQTNDLLHAILGFASTNQAIWMDPPQQPGAASLTATHVAFIIPFLVPMLVALIKAEVPKLPGWSLPILAPALGALADYLAQWAGVHTGGMVQGAILGAAGVGIREFKDQIQGRIAQTIQKPGEAISAATTAADKQTTTEQKGQSLLK